MFRYNRITHNQMDLYLKGLQLQPNTSYELSLDIYGGPINIFVTGYNIAVGSGSHYIDYNTVWTRHTIPFTTGSDTDTVNSFAEWGIAFVKKPGERLPTDAEDTYIDNVRLVSTDTPHISVVEGGDFEAAKNDPIYDANWKREILGIAGQTCDVDIVTDPCNKNNRCLRLPRLSRRDERLPLPLNASAFGCAENSDHDISFPKFKNENHLLLLVVRGRLTAETEQHSLTATDGQLVYFPHNASGYFTYHAGSGTLYYQLSFSEATPSTLLTELGFTEFAVFDLQDAAVIGGKINAMLQAPPQNRTYLHVIGGELLLMMAELERQLSHTAQPHDKHRPFIEELAERLRRVPEEPLYTAEEAAKCGLSECYFITLFKQHTGLSPHRYRLRELVGKACVLLQDTTMTVQEISYTLGVDDPLYFSRLFRSIQGLSPRDYRKHRSIY